MFIVGRDIYNDCMNGFQNYASFAESGPNVVGELARHCLVVGTEIAHLEPIIARRRLVYRRKKVIGIHQKNVGMERPVSGTLPARRKTALNSAIQGPSTS